MKNLNNFIIDNNITLDITKKTLNENMFNEKTNTYKGKGISEIKNLPQLLAEDISKQLEKWIKSVYKTNIRFDEKIREIDENFMFSFKTPVENINGILGGTFLKFYIFSEESLVNITDTTCDKYIPLYMHLSIQEADSKLFYDKEFNMNGSKSNIIYYDLEDEKIYIE